MICKKPFHQGVLEFGCGQCLPCRINRRRIWTHRMMLESLKHGGSSFITLTYTPEHLPNGATLVPKHCQNFLKRLRTHFAPLRVRFFAVGEYGDQTFRPHYHLALFGLSAFQLAGPDGRGDPLKSLWGMGHVFAGELTKDSAAYVGGYVTKKMTKADDSRLGGRYPEFARMSLRPGLGAWAMDDLSKVLMSSDAGVDHLVKSGDVPTALRHSGKLLPLGRYLRRKLREALGFGSLDTTEEAMRKLSQEMRRVFEEALASPEGPTEGLKYLEQVKAQRILNAESRFKIHNKRGAL